MTDNWPPPEDDSPPAQPLMPPPDPATRAAINSAESPWGPPPDRSYAPQRPPYMEYGGGAHAIVVRPITNPYATTGLVLGIIGACFFWVPILNFILATLAIIFGGIGWYQARVRQTGRGRGIAGVTLGIITMIGWFVFWAVVAASVSSAGAAALADIDAQTSSASSSAAIAPIAPTHHRDATKHDFKVTLKVTDEQCFGYAAGCQVQYNAYLKYVGPKNRKPAANETYHVTYRVTGGNAGPVVASFLTDGATADYQSGFDTTDRREQKLHATVTSVEKYL